MQQRTKFDHVIAVLTPEVANEVQDLILNPPGDAPYDLLKAVLIKRMEASEQCKLQQLLTAEELGDRKPSQLLRHMQQLLGSADSPPKGAFVRQLFLQPMPPSVRMVLGSASTTLTLPQLAEMADRILEVANPPTIAPGHHTSVHNGPATGIRPAIPAHFCLRHHCEAHHRATGPIVTFIITCNFP